MQLKVFCCSCFFFWCNVESKTFFSWSYQKSCWRRQLHVLSCVHFDLNVTLKRKGWYLKKFGHDNVVFICCKCFAIHISFLEEYLMNRLRDRCYRFEKVSNDSYIQSLKKHYINYQDIFYSCVANCYDYMLEMFYLLLVWNSSMIKLFEIALTIVIVLILILNGHNCLFSMCFGGCYMSGVYFIHWVYYHFVFLKKFQKLDRNLSECFEELEVILSSLKCQEEEKKKKSL